jgi:carotenoid 1,2-hydratase
VFSPYYAWNRRRGRGNPLQHCALNVALYGQNRRWAMTERGSGAIHRTASEFVIGPSALHWDGDVLTIHINERTMPFAGHVRGTVHVYPQALTNKTFPLDSAGRHRWSPLAPSARVEVTLEDPALKWLGSGYLDSNEGDAALEDSFASWHWCRAGIGADTAILYEVSPHEPPGASLALRIDKAGAVTAFPAPPPVRLVNSRWGIPRHTRADPEGARVRQTLEDTPFYARSVLDTHLLGHQVTAMHESLSLTRFRKPWVQAMLPFKMPRVWG